VGCALESELRSDGLELANRSLDEFYGQVSHRQIAGVVNLGLDMKLWVSWLALGRPIVCSIQTNDALEKFSGETVNVDFRLGSDGNYNHAVVIAGWRVSPDKVAAGQSYDLVAAASNADSKTEAQKDVHLFNVEYLVRDSSISGWGNGGYAWIPHPVMLRLAYEAYGVLLSKEEITHPGPIPQQRSWATGEAPAAAART